ncbi:hypothetical protein [Mycobacterium sp. 852002-10029_SCH5224772]|uniref:hypothetical protein n=1 Tax=Mycobacterium sp. 852002-10029_SCH5224772 TaxID=1834083 RepID=UPI0007FFD328|nr:hypothetical protein [Mycobacterium sp. 852002-10029_SCH5224772]OBE99011.1 hypothetical protein A5775_07695 [Mycobacterium sp. 852002-10029_SCH5224772]
MNDEEFFLKSDSDQLRKIHGWACARYVSPWAVLFGVLLRVAASVPPNVQLPAVIGGRASLNLLCAFVGRSGAGKGSSAKVAALAWPVEILTLPLGSGQGIAEVFARRSGSGEIEPVIFEVPEVDALTALTKTQGSVLLPTVKSLAMGEQIGQTNATKDSSRNVPAHSYRACLSVGVQPGHANVIFGDTTGGTPQRFLWVPVTDPNIADGDFRDPAPLVTDLPIWNPGADDVVDITYGFPEIVPAIRAANIARNRGEADALDGHAVLTRCKVAALLAIMHRRSEVTEWDWDKSGKIMAVSDRTRASLLKQEAEIRAAAFRERGKNDALRCEGREDYKREQLESVKASIVAVLTKRGGVASASDLNSALGKPHRRKLLAQALAELVDEGRVLAISVAGGTRYRLTGTVQGEQSVQGVSSHVSGDERRVQDERSATVVSMEAHRPQKTDTSRISCQKWFDGHLAELRAKGHDTVEGAAVREAGEAAGYAKNQLYVAANTRGHKGTHWTLAG